MLKATIYTTRFCPYCIRAKQLLESKSIQFTEIAVDQDDGLRQEMMRKSGQRTVPQIWLNDKHVGGCDDLYSMSRSGELDNLLNQ